MLFTLIHRDPEQKKLGQQRIEEATLRLLEKNIPQFARYLSKKLRPVDLNKDTFSLTNEVHRHGINIRHLGRVRKELQKENDTPFKKQFILIEIAARTAKNHLRSIWREKMIEKKVYDRYFS